MKPPKMLPRNNANPWDDSVGKGLWLLKQKAKLPSDKLFLEWLEKNCPGLSRRSACNKMQSARIYLKDPTAKFPSERAARASSKTKPQAVARTTKQQRLVQAIAERLFKLENSPQIAAFYHAAFTPDTPPRKELERHVFAWAVLLAENGLTN